MNIDAFQTLRVYYLDKQIKEYVGMDKNGDSGKYYNPISIYYTTDEGSIINYSEVIISRIPTIVYNDVLYVLPNNSLIIEIEETNTPPEENKDIAIESREGNQGFNRISIGTRIMDKNCFERSNLSFNNNFCNGFLERSKIVKNIIFISKSPIQSKYASSIDGLTIVF